MAKYVLGLCGFYHDSSACIFKDGELLAFAEEERFSRKKHTHDYPYYAVEYCLETAGVRLDDLEAVAFYVNPWMQIITGIKIVARYFPGSLNLFRKGTAQTSLAYKYRNIFGLKSLLKKRHGARGDFRFVTIPHHVTHQANAFYCSPFKEAAIMTMDVAADGVTQTIARGSENSIESIVEHKLPHAWGVLYSLFTHLVGFSCFDEYKVMGMAAYGEPKWTDFIEDKLYRLSDETGKFELNFDYIAYNKHGQRKLWTELLLQELGPPCPDKNKLGKREYDLASSIQKATERFGVRLGNIARKMTGSHRLCMSGGVIQNVLMNKAIINECGFDEVFIQPLGSDVGGSLGAALQYMQGANGEKRTYRTKHLYLGPSYESEYDKAIQSSGLVSEYSEDAPQLIAKAIAEGKVVGLFNGRMEAGPRALGSRSILADPRDPDMKDILNARVKHRESFRPFAPSVLEERMDELFEPLPACCSSGYMIRAADVREEKKGCLAAVAHVDGTVRPQAVSREFNPFFWEIIYEFYKLTGVPAVINTSFNDNEPIVCTPMDAIRCFRKSNIDLLAFESTLVYRSENSSVCDV